MFIKFKTKLYIDEDEKVFFTIQGRYYPAMPAMDHSPEIAEDIECDAIFFAGVELTYSQETDFINNYGYEKFYTWLYEEAKKRVTKLKENNIP